MNRDRVSRTHLVDQIQYILMEISTSIVALTLTCTNVVSNCIRRLGNKFKYVHNCCPCSLEWKTMSCPQVTTINLCNGHLGLYQLSIAKAWGNPAVTCHALNKNANIQCSNVIDKYSYFLDFLFFFFLFTVSCRYDPILIF